MPARKPEDAHRLFAEAMNAGNLESLLALYEEEPATVPQLGSGADALAGTAPMRGALRDFLALEPRITLETRSVVRAGDVALLGSKWRLAGTASDGAAVELAGTGTELVRRAADGTWRYVIGQSVGADAPD